MDEGFLKLAKEISGKSILVTGATGLIGSTCIKMLAEANEVEQLDINIYALVRDEEKAMQVFGDRKVYFLCGDVASIDFDLIPQIDYIIHGASMTASKSFVEQPVETIKVALNGSMHMLELAKEKKVKSMVYLSSMEVYGEIREDVLLTEDDLGYIDLHSVRSSYSESKRMIENLCVAYASEYNVPVKIVRLTQTFGPGVAKDDVRVFAEFARCAMEGRDIVIHSSGQSKKMYLYTEDAATAIIVSLLRGVNGCSYNAANDMTYCSILEMANIVKNEIAKEPIEVIVENDSEKSKKYPPESFVKMDISKIREIGWEPKVSLKEMYILMISHMK